MSVTTVTEGQPDNVHMNQAPSVREQPKSMIAHVECTVDTLEYGILLMCPTVCNCARCKFKLEVCNMSRNKKLRYLIRSQTVWKKSGT